MKAKKKFDLVVCGGGLAGVSAAIAASRLGVKTALIQDRPILGGNSSSEIRVALAGAANGNPWARESGIIEELALTERFNNFTSRRESRINDVWDLVLYDKCRQEDDLTLFLNTYIRQVRKKNKYLLSVQAVQLASEQELDIRGDYFVDSTGDGVVAHLAGAEYRIGREAKHEFNEQLAPEKQDIKTMGSTLLFSVKDIGKPTPFRPPSWAVRYPAADKTLKLRKHDCLPGYWWIEVGYPFDTIFDNSNIYDELMRHVMGVWDHLKNQEDHGFNNYALDWIAKIPGKRESRRIVGDYILNGNDLMEARKFEDAVSHGGWYFDLHTPGGILAKDDCPEPTYGDASKWDLCAVPVYSIPLRSLYSKDIKNLFMAGRNISATHVALGSTRLMATCAAMGQAVGTCASFCKQYRTIPKKLSAKNIKLLQQQLLKNDVYIPNIKNEDPKDLARSAKITCSSSSPLYFSEPIVPKKLDVPLGQVFPVSTNRIDVISLFMEAQKDTKVKLSLSKARSTCDFKAEKDIHVVSKTVKKGRSWIDFPVLTDLQPQSLYWIGLDRNPSISVFGSGSFIPTGTVSIFKPYARWLYMKPGLNGGWTMSLRIEPQQYPYKADNILSGVTRSDFWTNLWISDPKEHLPQWVSLELKKPVSLKTIHIIFDTNLSLFHNLHLPTWKAPDETVKDYRILYRKKEQWKEAETFHDNFLRFRIHHFKHIKTDAIKIEVLSTWGNPSARIFEVRLYGEAKR